jgi:hypothetical protein
MPLRVHNWRAFQHYQSRRPPWVKLHRTLLDDYDFIRLPLASQALAPRLWLLASESTDGSLPDDPAKLAFRLHCSEVEITEAVNPLISGGFLEGLLSASTALATRKQNLISETETEAEQTTALEQEGSVPRQRTHPPRPLKRGKGTPDYAAPIAAFNRAFALAFKRHATLPPDKATTFADRVEEGYPAEFLIGTPVAVRAAGLDQGRDVQPAFLLRNGSGSYTRNGETRKTFDWIGSLWQAADRLALTPAHAEMLREVGVLDWWLGRGATVQTLGGDEC